MTQPLQLQLFDSIPEPRERVHQNAIAEGIGTFADNLKLPIHRWFRYSAGFSALWVEQSIAQLKPQTILDPFAGSGTACIAADKLNVKSYGIEAHPFVYKLARGKLAWGANIQDFSDAIAEIKHLAALLEPNVPEPLPNLLKKCYTPDALIQLFKIKQAYLKLAPSFSEELNSLIFLAICAILRPCSYVGTAQWQYVLPKKRKTKTCKPFNALKIQTVLMQEDMEKIQFSTEPSQAVLIREDARNIKSIPHQIVDLVIASPPYANNYDYADATRLEMTFWGEVNSWGDLHDAVRQFLIRSSSQHVSKERLELSNLIAEPILAPIREDLTPICKELEKIRLTKGGRKAYHTMIAAYFCDMGLVFDSLRRVTKPHCKICFIVGDSAPYGVHVPVDKWLARLAISSGFNSWHFENIRPRNTKWKNRKHRVLLKEGILWINS